MSQETSVYGDNNSYVISADANSYISLWEIYGNYRFINHALARHGGEGGGPGSNQGHQAVLLSLN